MIIVDHYIKLFLYFKGLVIGEKYEMTVKKVSEILFCTDRNSKLILNRLEDQKWIIWVPGKGRGNRSTITFLAEPSQLVFNQAKEFVKKGNPREAKKVIEDFEPHFPSLNEQFEMWFETLFGYHTENGETKSQDTLRLKFSKLPIAPLDPNLISLRSECHIVQHVCDTLVTFNKETGGIEPHLAFYWESHEEKTWTFYLRKGILFHDGQPLTSDDVVFTFKRAFKNENMYSWLVENIEVVRSMDAHTVEFILKEPNCYFLNLLCDEHLSILPKRLNNEIIHNSIIGTGPYKLVRNDENILVMEAFDSYFRERPFLDRVEYWFTLESEMLSFEEIPKENELLWVGVYPQDRTDGTDEYRQEQSILEWNVQFLSLNIQKEGPLTHPAFRKVLKEILNPSDLIQELGGDRGQVAVGFLPNNQVGGQPQIDTIDSLLKESHYNGETLELYTFDDWDHHEDVEWIIKRCSQYGIVVKPTFLSDIDLLKIENIKSADLIHDSATMGEQFELSFLHLIFADNSFIKNHLTDEIQNKIKRMVKHFYEEPCKNQRLPILQAIQQILLDFDAVIPLYRNVAYANTDVKVQNVKVNTQGWIDLHHIWFKKSK